MAQNPTPDQVALVRRRYLDRVAVRDILAEAGLKLGTLYRCLDGDFPDGSGVKPAPIPRRLRARVRHPAGSRTALVARMWRTAERQVEEIEARLRGAGIELAERESNARTLAILAKTLRELSAVEEMTKGGKPPDNDTDDDPVPRDINEFRRELARRIEALVDSRTHAGGADKSG